MTEKKSKDETSIIYLTPEELSRRLSDYLKDDFKNQVENILSKRENELGKRITFEQTMKLMDVSRHTLSRFCSEGKIRFTSLQKNNPKSKKFFKREDIEEFWNNNRTNTINEIRNSDES